MKLLVSIKALSNPLETVLDYVVEISRDAILSRLEDDLDSGYKVEIEKVGV